MLDKDVDLSSEKWCKIPQKAFVKRGVKISAFKQMGTKCFSTNS